MTIYKTQVCLIGACMGQENWGFADNVALTPPTDQMVYGFHLNSLPAQSFVYQSRWAI